MTDNTSDQQLSEQTESDRRADPDRRRSVLDRRTGLDRRHLDRQVSDDRRTGLDRRRGPGIRLEPDRKAAEEGEMTDEQFEFIMAVDRFKRTNNRPFPTLTEILEVIKDLGYKKLD